MSAEFTVENRPAKAAKNKDRPWVILMAAHPKPVVVARCSSEEEALDAADRLGFTMAARRAASRLDGFES